MKKKEKAAVYSTVSNIIFLLKDIRQIHPTLFVLILIQGVCSVISPVFGIYFPKVAVEMAVEGTETLDIVVRLGGLGLLMALSMALAAMAQKGKYLMLNDMRSHYYRRIYMKSLYCDYSQIESVEGQRRYIRAVSVSDYGDASASTVMIEALIAIFINVSGFIVYSAIISTLNIAVIVLLAALSLVNYFAVKNAQTYQYEKQDEAAGIRTKIDYIERTAEDVQYGKDIRLYGMKNWFFDLQDKTLDVYMALRAKIRNRYFGAGCVNAATLLIRDGAAYAYLIYSVTQGKIGTGDFVLYFGAVTGFSDFVGNIIDKINEMHKANLQMNDLRAFLDVESDKTGKEIKTIPQGEGMEIDFEHVTFSYDEQSGPILLDFNLHIGKGEKIALVGVNGAGKTSVVKLLCGFYRPDAGRILINGTDIREYRRDDLPVLFSAVFQDIFIPPFSVAENVAMQFEQDADMERAAACLKQSGLYDKICEYPQGIHSHMTKVVEDGIVLSGGEQQKLLMARALYKDAPILILDEPTAALDPIAESETYENFHQFSQGKTAIYISHRLASTRFCDRIVFLQDGRIAESGTHEELMALGKEYAKMYEIQSRYYQTGKAQMPQAERRERYGD
ncbi:MAG: ABC transporter ATP-binding protein/permease [Ruminococcus sp.]|nr:ABC transporter ATP-binding protein/permease [Ruminococcus sp.]